MRSAHHAGSVQYSVAASPGCGPIPNDHGHTNLDVLKCACVHAPDGDLFPGYDLWDDTLPVIAMSVKQTASL